MVIFISEYNRYTTYVGMLWVIYVILFVGGMCAVFKENIITLYTTANTQAHITTYMRKFQFFLKYYMYGSSGLILHSAYVHVHTLMDKGILEKFGPYGCVRVIIKYTRTTTDAINIRIYQNTGFVLCTLILCILYIIGI